MSDVEKIIPSDLNSELLELTQELFPANLNEVGITFNDPIAMREKIEKFVDICMALPQGKIQIKTTHSFTKGLYSREVFIPKGSIVIGRIHRHECVSIMSMGDKTCLTEDGVKRLKAPFSAISRAGIKRVGFAHEDSVWTTVHATNERDIKKLEEDLFTENYSDVEFKGLDILTFTTMEGKLCQE